MPTDLHQHDVNGYLALSHLQRASPSAGAGHDEARVGRAVGRLARLHTPTARLRGTRAYRAAAAGSSSPMGAAPGSSSARAQ